MGKITIVGTGWTRGQLTLDAVEVLTCGAQVILHTERCGCAQWLEDHHIPYHSLDDLYESCEDFDAHADAAVQAVLGAAQGGDVVYGVFDVRDLSAVRLLAQAEARVIAGPPAEGPLLALATGEARCVAASEWEDFHLTPRENCFIRELDGAALASEVKLKLMEVYPEESEVWLLKADSAPERVPLYALDRVEGLDHRACALVPAQRDIHQLERYDYMHLVEIIRFLCSPQGCPWDRVQTHETLRSSMLEEAYEVIDAIDAGDPDHLYDELGDMLMQIVLHAEIGRKHGEFDTSDVTTAICRKMIQRHTHVFGRDHAENAKEVLGLWAKNKMAERGQKTRTETLRDVPRAFPSTLRAAKIFKRTADAGIEVDNAETLLNDCREQLSRALHSEQNFGDLLLALCNAARKAGIDPELALSGACDRFIARFNSAETEMLSTGDSFEGLSPVQRADYWRAIRPQ